MPLPPRQIPNRLTPVSFADLWNEVLLGFEKVGVSPTRSSVELVLAQIEGESACRKSVHNFNLPNIKFSRNHMTSWQFFGCGENVTPQALATIQRMRSGCVTVQSEYHEADGAKKFKVWIVPFQGWTGKFEGLAPEDSHPWTKFAAHDSLEEGLDHTWTYFRNHPDVRAALMTGNLPNFNAALRRAGFYTASQGAYLAMLKSQLKMVQQRSKDYNWGDVV